MTEWKEFEIKMSGTMFDRDDPKQLQPPNFKFLRNAEFDKRGALEQRSGKIFLARTVKQPNSTTPPVAASLPPITTGSALVGFGDRLLMSDGKYGYEYINNRNAWRNVGFFGVNDVNSSRISMDGDTVIGGTATYANGYTAYVARVAQQQSPAILTPAPAEYKLTLVDESNKSLVYDSRVLNVAPNPVVTAAITAKTVWCKSIAIDNIIVIAVYTAGSQINLYSIDTNDAALPVVSILVTGDAFTASTILPGFDMCHPPGAAFSYLSYRVSAVAIKTITFLSNGIVIDSTSTLGNNATTAFDGPVAIGLSSNLLDLWVVTGEIGGSIKGAKYGLDLHTRTLNNVVIKPISTVNRIAVLPNPITSNQLDIFYEYDLAATAAPFLTVRTTCEKVTATGSYGVLSTLVLGQNMKMSSKPFARGNDTYILLSFYRIVKSTVAPPPIGTPLLLDGTSFLVRSDYNSTFGATSNWVSVIDVGFHSNSVPGDVAIVSSDIYRFATDRTTGIFPKYSLNSVSIDFRKKKGVTSGIFKKNLAISGSQLYQFDGDALFENGPYYYPKYAIDNSTAGGTFANGKTYQIAIVYKYIDGNGNIFYSDFYQTSYLNSAATRKLTFEVDVLRSERRNALIDVYISQADSLILNLAGSFPNTETTPGTGYVFITIADPPLTTSDVLYSTGGVIKNSHIPSPDVIHVHDNRLFAIVNESSLYYSKTFTPGEGLGTSSILSSPLPTEAGIPVALGSLDNNLAIFHETSTYLQSGDGPNSLGIGAFNGPQKILVDVGCDKFSAPSVVRTNSGLIFKSKKGFYLLSRDFSSTRIDNIIAMAQEDIVSSNILTAKSQIRINTRSPATLVYDYLENRWGTRDAEDSVGASVFAGKYAWMGVDGTVNVEDDSVSQIVETVAMEIDTGWINLAGVQGYQRIRRFGVNLFDQIGNFFVDVYFDYDDSSIAESYTFASPGLGNSNIRQRLARQRCQAIRFAMRHERLSGTSRVVVSSMMLELGIIPGIYRRD